MSRETYNAVLRFRTTPGAGAWPAYVKEFEARQWLVANNYPAPLIVYRNVSPSKRDGTIVVVLADRTAALMLKLALAQV